MNYALLIAVVLAIVAANPLYAQDDAHPVVQTASVAQANTVAGIMATVKKSIDDSKTVIAANDLKSVHPHTGKGMDALKTLLSVAAPAPEKKERLEIAIKQMNSRLDALHDAADGGDAAKTQNELKKTEGAFKLLELQTGK
jgi:hypothetical protein